MVPRAGMEFLHRKHHLGQDQPGRLLHPRRSIHGQRVQLQRAHHAGLCGIPTAAGATIVPPGRAHGMVADPSVGPADLGRRRGCSTPHPRPDPRPGVFLTGSFLVPFALLFWVFERVGWGRTLRGYPPHWTLPLAARLRHRWCAWRDLLGRARERLAEAPAAPVLPVRRRGRGARQVGLGVAARSPLARLSATRWDAPWGDGGLGICRVRVGRLRIQRRSTQSRSRLGSGAADAGDQRPAHANRSRIVDSAGRRRLLRCGTRRTSTVSWSVVGWLGVAIGLHFAWDAAGGVAALAATASAHRPIGETEYLDGQLTNPVGRRLPSTRLC